MAYPVRTPAPAVTGASAPITTTIRGSCVATKYRVHVTTNDKANNHSVCETLTAKIESFAKIYLGNLRFPCNQQNYNVFNIGVECSGGMRTRDTVVITLLYSDFQYVFNHLSAIPKVGATIQDVERVFQSVPSLQEGIDTVTRKEQAKNQPRR